jgi:terminase large subunit-like protein
VPHLDPAEKIALLATTPLFQREARTKGIPQLGAGAIYQLPESELKISPFDLPKHWPRCWGMDTDAGAGWTAVVWLALDRETQTLYLYDCYKRQREEPTLHAATIKARGDWIPGVGDAAALVMTQQDAEQLVALYRRLGLDIILPDKAVETGLQEVWEYMSAGRFKVFASCEAWFQEYRLYHRGENGRIVKTNDHLMDATRYAVRSGRARMKAHSRRLRHNGTHQRARARSAVRTRRIPKKEADRFRA